MSQDNYGFWRTDKPKEPGFSHELISCDYKLIKHQTSMDELLYFPDPAIDTLLKAFENNCKRMPGNELLGTRNGDKYDWMTFQQVQKSAMNYAAGCQKLGLCPDVEGEGKTWRFMGIQSKNRKEWNVVHIANMYLNTTTIALYDTLGVDALRFVINQTELSTISGSQDIVDKLTQHKINDLKLPTDQQRLHRLKFLVSFEKVLDVDILAKVE